MDIAARYLPRPRGSRRAQAGRLHLGHAAFDAPDHHGADETPAVGYVRPHELEVARYSPGCPGITAILQRSLPVGGSARLELKRQDTGDLIEAEIPLDSSRSLRLREGETLVVRPKRLRVFADVAASAGVPA